VVKKEQTMNRLTLSPEHQALIDEWRAANNVQPTDVIIPGTNAVVDDHFWLVDSFNFIVAGPGGGNTVQGLVPEWEMFEPMMFDGEAITDRIGPNGETMPMQDEEQMRAMMASTGAENPKTAKKDRREQLRDFLAAQTADVAREIRKRLKLDDKD
jgi:hypothetical protein